MRANAIEPSRYTITTGSILRASRITATLILIAAAEILLAGCKSSFVPIYQTQPGGADTAATIAAGSPLPEISLVHYRVALAHLENDSGGQVEAQLRRALVGLDRSFAIEIVLYNATLSSSPAAADIAAARAFLGASGAQEIIGGTVIAGGKQLVRLAIVSPPDNGFAGIYEPAYFRFPTLTAADNAVLLQLAIANQSVAFLAEGICGHAFGHLFALIAKARSIADRSGADVYWDRDSNARLNLIVADAMRSSASLDGSEPLLRRSLVYSLLALADFAQLNSAHDSAIAGWRFASALAQLGQWRADQHYLSASMDVLRDASELLEAQHDDLDSALAQEDVAFALFAIPGSDGRKQRLEQVLHIYQAVIARFPHETYPRTWQMEERNIAITISAIGGMEPGNQHLDESIAAFRALLAASTKHDTERAITESDLGIVLIARAQRDDSPDDVKEVVRVERDALKSLDPCFPSPAGDAENALGLALLSLGMHQNSGAEIAQAATAFNSALSAYAHFGTREKIAMAESNLAEAEREMGSRNGGTIDLQAAVSTQRAALRSLSRARNPLQWAILESRLAETLRRLGDQKSNDKLLNEAIAADRDALKILTPQTDLQTWRQTQSDLGNALNSLAISKHGQIAIDDAQASLAAFQEVLSTVRKDTDPRGWASLNAETGEALTTWGANESSNDHLERAVEALNQSLALINPHDDPANWAYTENDLGIALATLGEREAGTARLEQSAAAYRNALTVLSKDKNDAQFKDTTDALDAVLAELKRRGKPNG